MRDYSTPILIGGLLSAAILFALGVALDELRRIRRLLELQGFCACGEAWPAHAIRGGHCPVRLGTWEPTSVAAFGDVQGQKQEPSDV